MNRLNLSFQTFTHSTIAQLPAEAQNFNESLKWSDVVDPSGAIPTLHITLIWKDVKQPELISTVTNYVPIIGEVSVLRFLTRLGPNEFHVPIYPLDTSVTNDATLDTVAQLALKQTPKARQQLWNKLVKILGSKQFYGTELLTVADVAVSSLIKQRVANNKDLLKPLADHLERVNGVVRYTQ